MFLVSSQQGPGFYATSKSIRSFEKENTVNFEQFMLFDQFVATIQTRNSATYNHDIIYFGSLGMSFIVRHIFSRKSGRSVDEENFISMNRQLQPRNPALIRHALPTPIAVKKGRIISDSDNDTFTQDVGTKAFLRKA